MIGVLGFYVRQPFWLVAGLLVIPAAYLAWRNRGALPTVRHVVSLALRALTILLLAVLLARPTLTESDERMTLLVVRDRSQSVPELLHASAMGWLDDALAAGSPEDQIAVVDVAEAASIARLAGSDRKLPQRAEGLMGSGSRLSAGVQMAMAIAPPETACRILLVSDGNETQGDLREAARVAAANGIPVDVLPLRYDHEHEVVFERLVVPPYARSGQTIPLRLVLRSSGAARGTLTLSLNGKPVDLDPTSPAIGVRAELKKGTNVRSLSLPMGPRGVHEFEAQFVPDGEMSDGIHQNNRAAAVSFVAGPGRVLVVDSGGLESRPLLDALAAAEMHAEHCLADDFPQNIARLLDTDAVVLVNTPNTHFSYAQQEMLVRYVQELGGGLMMIGGPDSFGAGGWIGSPIAEVLPVDLDPPQKKQMPKGALVLIMHACEMPRGNYWGKKVAIAAVQSLSRLDLVGVIDYAWNAGDSNWVFPLQPAGDKEVVTVAIQQMQMGDMPDFGAPMRAAYNKLKGAEAGQKHIIIISDGDPAPPSPSLLKSMKEAGISCSGVCVFPHDPSLVQSLQVIAKATGGRFYHVKDPSALPKIFIKEAQVVRRSLILENTFQPKVTYALGEVVRGLADPLVPLDGYVLTGSKGGAAQTLISGPDGDPILAATQAGVGRCAAFTSSADGRWAGQWLAWGGFNRFWEQAIRWVSRPSQSPDCEVFTEAEGRRVTVVVEAAERGDGFVPLTGLAAQVIAPDMSVRELSMEQVGPGRYRAQFDAPGAGSHVVNLRYHRGEAQERGRAQAAVTVPYAPEFGDLSDNAALLREVASLSGGRVLGGLGAEADVFRRAGVEPPQTAMPLTLPLLLVLLAVFLADVAVRRIAVDIPAIARRVAGALSWRRRKGGAEKTLDRLKQRRGRVRERLSGGADKKLASRRYEGANRPDAPMAPPSKPKPKPASPAPAAEQDQTSPPQTETPDTTHLSRLLRAKRRAGKPGSDPKSGESQ
jgi:uncharacterized membrane protein